jgi:hypothetical protein
LHNAKAALLKEFGEAVHRWMKADVVVDLQNRFGADAEDRPVLAIDVIGVGNDRVQAVVSAG